MTRRIPLLLVLSSLLAAPALADGPAKVASSGDSRAEASFQRFAEGWMDKVKRMEADNRRNPTVQPGASGPLTTYRGYAEDFSIELRPTGHSAAPYIGLLRYTELMYSCQDDRCSVASQVPVTEIFRFQDGRWVY